MATFERLTVRPAETRSACSMVRFTPTEFRDVAAGAAHCGMTPARFIREAALGALAGTAPRPRADVERAPKDAESIRQLGRIGATLREIGERLRASSATSDAPANGADAALATQLDVALTELVEAIRRAD